MKLKRFIKKVYNSPLGSPASALYRGIGTVLVYHRVTKDIYPKTSFHPEIGLAVNIDQFESQMEYLSSNYECISLAELEQVLEKKIRHHKHFVAVTFDDGFRDNLENALPILEAKNVPACVFVTTGFINRQFQPWWLITGSLITKNSEINLSWQNQELSYALESKNSKYQAFFELDRLMKSLNNSEQAKLIEQLKSFNPQTDFSNELLNWKELKKLSKSACITVGAHTVSHASLVNSDPEEVLDEFKASKAELEERLDCSIRFNAYPFGSANECSTREFEASKAAGYSLSFTTRFGHIHKRHRKYVNALPRIAIDHYHTIEKIDQLVFSGLACLLKQKGRYFIVD